MNEQMTPSPAEEPDIGWEITKKITIKAVKIIFPLLLLYFVVSCVIYCIPSLREGYWEFRVKTYVQLHQNALNEYVETFPLDEPMTREKYHGWTVTSYPVHEYGLYSAGSYDFCGGDPYIIQFDRFGFGLAVGGSYAGMYYSPEDTPVGFQGIFLDTPGAADGETEKICDHWYWYIAWF
ncbi:MAG: hypothetical protein ACI3W7_07405 [Oscillospiraceae bacterium]